jgi:hypothetical protein
MIKSSTANQRKKRPGWTRAADILVRTAHVAGTSIIFGGSFFKIPFDRIIFWYYAALITGAMLIISEIYHRPYWIHQGRGIMVLIHVGLLGLLHLLPNFRIPILLLAIVFGMVGSHMPKKFRYWSFVHGHVID